MDKASAIGQLQAGVHQNEVAQTFGVHQSTKTTMENKVQRTGDVKDRQSGRNRVTTPAEDSSIRLVALRNQRMSSRINQTRPHTARIVENHLQHREKQSQS